MRKLTCLFLIVAFFITSHIFPAEAAWTEPSQACHIAALDKARGWNECVDKAKENADIANMLADCPGGEVNMEGYTSSAQEAFMYNMAGKLGAGRTFCTDERATSLNNSSALGLTTNLIAGMYQNQPASFSYYARDLLENGGFVQTAYAQGIGYSGLRPILSLWKVARNLSYIILVIVLVVVGFLIMFRMKLDAQTAISVQNSLPNIVITLVLITFSYAIAGLMIDLMYFLILIIISVFVQGGLVHNVIGGEVGTSEVAALQEFFLNAGWGRLFRTIVWEESLWVMSKAIFLNFGGAAVVGGPAFLLLIPGTNAIAAASGLALAALPTLLIFLALFFVFLRIFFLMLNCYVQILISVITAPLQLLIGAIPGQNTFKNWLFGLIGNLIVFPAAIAIFLLGNSITALTYTEVEGRMWSPPFLVGTDVSEGTAEFLSALIGFGIIMLTPTLLNTIKGLFHAKPFLPISAGIILSPIQGGYQTLMTVAQSRMYMGDLPGLNKIPGFGKGGHGPSHADKK